MGSTSFVDCVFSFESHGCYMIALEWDPDRYDYLSENRLFLISWSIWDFTEFAEARVLNFCWFPIFRLFAVAAMQFIWTVRTF